MAQTQKKNSTLLCTFRKCRQPQIADNEFCTRHQAKKGRNDLMEALNQLDEWADEYTASLEEKKLQEKLYDKLMDFIIYS